MWLIRTILAVILLVHLKVLLKGHRKLRREVLRVLAVDFFKMEDEQFDGYIAPGGTEANIQAIMGF